MIRARRLPVAVSPPRPGPQWSHPGTTDATSNSSSGPFTRRPIVPQAAVTDLYGLLIEVTGMTGLSAHREAALSGRYDELAITGHVWTVLRSIDSARSFPLPRIPTASLMPSSSRAHHRPHSWSGRDAKCPWRRYILVRFLLGFSPPSCPLTRRMVSMECF